MLSGLAPASGRAAVIGQDARYASLPAASRPRTRSESPQILTR